MSLDTLADFFMPETRKYGKDLFNKEAVSIASASDTEASAYVKASGSPRVSLVSTDIANSNFQANCTCPAAKKERLCKHIWATILKLKADEYDFLACKTSIEKAAAPAESEARLAAKARQAQYKQKLKEQNKARNKKFRQSKKQAAAAAKSTYPAEVQEALNYFSNNGFELSEPLRIEALNTARKTLAHIFHPDKGGAHIEIIDLNKNHDILAEYLDRC